MANRIQFRRDTAANWTSVNPILAQGELGIELNTGKLKIGNGITAWASLPYFTLNYSDLVGAPANLSDLTNDSGYITAADLPANELPLNAVGYLFNDGTGTLSWDSVVGPTAVSQLDNDTGFITSTDRLTASGAELVLTGGLNPYVTFPAIPGGDQIQVAGSEILSLNNSLLALTSRGDLVAISNAEGLHGGSSMWRFNAQGDIELPNKFPIQFTAVFDAAHYAGVGTFTGDGTVSLGVELQGLGAQFQWLVDDPTFTTNRGYVGQQAFRYTAVDHGITGFIVDILVEMMGPDIGSGLYSLQVAFSPAPSPADLAKIRSGEELMISAADKGWLFDIQGDLYLPPGGDIRDSTGTSVLNPVDYTNFNSDLIPDVDNTRSLGTPTRQWKELYVSTGSIYIGNVKLSNTGGTLQINTVETQIDPDTQEEVEVVLETESIQFTRTSNLELTNKPLIVQPVVLGTPVTVTVPLSGQGAQFTVIIENTGTTMSSGVTEAGTGYVVGQIYKIYYYQIGGSDPSGDITLTVTEVNQTGGIVSYDVLWSGPNVDNTYQFVSIDYQPISMIDTISPEVVLTRGAQQGIYNTVSELEYDNQTYLSPLGTEWNSDGWGTLLELGTRTYTTWRQALNNAVGNNIVASELVMRDIANDRYYKFDFTAWGGSNDGYSYTRTEVTDPNYYRKQHNAESADIVIEDDPVGTGIVIGRTDSAGIYNLAQEAGFVADSPAGTTWNADGWDDLSNIATRTYQVFDLAANGYNSVLGKKFVMKVASANKYYAIQFYEWATNGDNNFAYVRYEIDQTKLNEGITFPDGTKLKSAAGVGRIKSTAVGDRRIEEVTGYNSVSVTARTTNDYTGASARTTTTNYEIFVKRTPTLDAVIIPLTTSGNNFTVEISFDGVTYLPSWLSSVQETEYWFYYENNSSYVPQTEDNPVYLRFTSGADPHVWWNKADLPGGEQDFRGAIIDYHAYTGESTIIGTIHIVRDSGEEHISHQEVQSGSTDGENDDLWFVQNEGTVSYRRTDGESKTLKVHWTAKVFYGSEFWD